MNTSVQAGLSSERYTIVINYGVVMKKVILFLSVTLLSINVFGADIRDAVGTIDKVQLMGKNYASYSTAGEAIAFIHMEALPASCDNSNGFKRVAITSDHPAFNVVVSTALAAKASGATVQIHYLAECTLWNTNAWDFAIINIM